MFGLKRAKNELAGDSSEKAKVDSKVLSSQLTEIADIEQLITQAARMQSENTFLRVVTSVSLVLTLLAIFGAYTIAMRHIQAPVQEKFFAITDDGRLTSITDEADKYSESMLLQFAKEAAIESFSFDFVQSNNEEHLNQDVRKYYSKSGFNAYLKALDDGQYLRRLYANKQIARATAIGQPLLQNVIERDGTKYYIVTAKLHVDFIGTKNIPDSQGILNIRMAMTRLPVYEAVRGVGIVQIEASFEK